ncbi:MAG TPA: hypothetical protein VGF17_17795, partial [Phytomonospora sp.]
MAVRQRRPARRPMSGRLLGAGLLILLALFTLALAAGSRSLGAGLLAFLLLGGGVAILTKERISNKLRRTPRPEPRNPPGPVEEFIAEMRGDDPDDEDEEEEVVEVVEVVDDGELASIDDLEARLSADDDPPPPPPPPAPVAPKQRQPAWDPKPKTDDRNERYAGHVDLGGPLDDSRAFVADESFLPAASVRDVAATQD